MIFDYNFNENNFVLKEFQQKINIIENYISSINKNNFRNNKNLHLNENVYGNINENEVNNLNNEEEKYENNNINNIDNLKYYDYPLNVNENIFKK